MRGELIDGVHKRLRQVDTLLDVRLLSADTFGTAAAIASELGIDSTVVADGEAKRDVITSLDGSRCVAIGNGANDAPMLREAALAIAVIGGEGAAGETIAAADLVVYSVTDALDLLLEPRSLVASLRL